MSYSLINGLLVMCLNHTFICQNITDSPKVKYYEPFKACYIEGVFYSSCPQKRE